MNTSTTISYWARSVVNMLQQQFQLSDSEMPLVQRLLQAHEQGHVCLCLDEEAVAHLQPLVESVNWLGLPEMYRPVILDKNRLYLYRHHRDECIIAQALLARVGTQGNWNESTLHWLPKLFPQHQPGQPQHQQWLAVTASLLQRFSLISGGPGTGKTTTVIRLLSLLQMQDPELKVLLAAPTGKAAARLNEAMRAGALRLNEEHPQLPAVQFEPAVTIHRLLGAGRTGFRHHRQQPLDCNCLIVDEASMVDQYLMARLCDALPDPARLILLGDAQQLSAVDAGSVLADIAGLRGNQGYSPALVQRMQQAGLPAPADHGKNGLADQIHVLRHSWRFDAHSAIGQLGEAVLAKDFGTLEHLLQSSGSTPQLLDDQGLQHWVQQHYRPVVEACTAKQALQQFDQARILVCQHEGYWGLKRINTWLSNSLCHAPGQTDKPQAIHGLPFLIRRNDPDTGLFNGDTGLFWQENGQLQACLWNEEQQLRRLHPARLPAWEPAWALTIHKSQGSEFDHVLLALPQQSSQVLSRELIYTGITRARSSCDFIGPLERLQEALQKKTERISGLQQRLQAE